MHKNSILNRNKKERLNIHDIPDDFHESLIIVNDDGSKTSVKSFTFINYRISKEELLYLVNIHAPKEIIDIYII